MEAIFGEVFQDFSWVCVKKILYWLHHCYGVQIFMVTMVVWKNITKNLDCHLVWVCMALYGISLYKRGYPHNTAGFSLRNLFKGTYVYWPTFFGTYRVIQGLIVWILQKILQMLRDINISLRWRFRGYQSQKGTKSYIFEEQGNPCNSFLFSPPKYVLIRSVSSTGFWRVPTTFWKRSKKNIWVQLFNANDMIS